MVVSCSDWVPWERVEVSGRTDPSSEERTQARGSCISDSTSDGAAGGPAAGAEEARAVGCSPGRRVPEAVKARPPIRKFRRLI